MGGQHSHTASPRVTLFLVSLPSLLLLHHHPHVIIIVVAAAATTSSSSFTPPPLPSSPLPLSSSPPPSDVLAATLPRPRRHPPSSSPPPSLMPSLASPPPTLSHTALPTSTASAIAGSPGSSASPKPLHSNSTSSPLLNHAAQLTAAQAPSQLALLLLSALADADALRRELSVAQSRATRAERLLASVQGLPSRASPDPNVDGEKTNGEREREKDVKAGSKVPESAVKAVLDAEARAEHAERVHADLAASLQSLCAQFTEVDRYEHACSLRSADARTTFVRLLSTASHVPVAYPSYPIVASSESPHFQHEQKDDTLSLSSLSLPHTISASPSGSSMLTGPGAHPARPRHPLPCDTPALCRHLMLQARAPA
ncbi:hypothetical protein DFH11DRAFT_1809661 [Phellopilus nigrolimitatus]|nr:hypothetical protein DFH11DRAFT_1809661 [Phellopilus nigrolimitatus]